MQSCLFDVNLADIVIRLDRGSRHLAANTAIREIGVEPAEAWGKTWEELGLPAEMRNLCREHLETVFITGTQTTFDTGILLCSEEMVYFRMQLLPEWDNAGQVKSVLVIARDITDLKKLEEEINRLGRLNLVGKIAAAMGHEIRNPLTTVRGFLQMLSDKEANGKSKEFFKIMIEELDRANSIISEYLSLVKNKPLEFKEDNLNQLVGSMYPLLQAAAFQCNKKVACDLGQIRQAMLDASELRQLILNLVKNGLEATPVNGCVTVKTFMDSGLIVLQIQDEGTGMSAQVLEKIGTPFFTTKESGTGLGLTVSYSIAKRHKAKIDVQSSPAGTSFYVRFPAL